MNFSCRWLTGALLVALAAPVCAAQQDPHALVARMVQHELSSQKQQNYWMYIDNNTNSGTTKIQRVVETPECWFHWLLSINGKPPGPAQQQKQRAEVNQLVNSAAAREKKRAAITHDGQKAEALVRELPNIFLYTDDGEQNGIIRLKFRPNPKFNPPTDAAKVFHNMQGTLLIDAKEERLAGISGTLMRQVNFGWGILGRLRKGGTFHVQQTQLAPEDWEVTQLDVHIQGKALFFKTISEQQHEVKSDFQHVPPNISLAQAASLAEHGETKVATATAP